MQMTRSEAISTFKGLLAAWENGTFSATLARDSKAAIEVLETTERESVYPEVVASLVQALQGILDAERNGRFHPRGIKQSRAEALYQAERVLEKIGELTTETQGENHD